MKKNIANKWVEALESGNYQQVDGQLKSKVNDKQCGYCCLGVLCDLYIKETGKGKWQKAADGSHDRKFVGNKSESAVLPKEVMQWAGIKSAEGELKVPVSYGILGDESNQANSLVSLNDDARFKFKQIAKVIKEQAAHL